jgi:hypothetical protein
MLGVHVVEDLYISMLLLINPPVFVPEIVVFPLIAGTVMVVPVGETSAVPVVLGTVIVVFDAESPAESVTLPPEGRLSFRFPLI